VRRLLAAVFVVLWAGVPAGAADWDAIEPGVSTMETVRAQLGGPTRTETQKIDSYEVATWTYDGAQAPKGTDKVVVEYGLLRAGGFRREVVRSLRLEPKAGVFTRLIVLQGWGVPDRAGKDAGFESFYYERGLVIIFEKDGWSAKSLTFTPPQPTDAARPPR
jgi:hypothetical protein